MHGHALNFALANALDEGRLSRVDHRRGRHKERRRIAAQRPHHFHEHARIKSGLALVHVGFDGHRSRFGKQFGKVGVIGAIARKGK